MTRDNSDNREDDSMADELDLERGDPSRADEPRRSRRRSSASTASDKPKTATEAKADERMDAQLYARLVDAFNQVVEWRQARDDEELATAIDEDKGKMSKGLVSLTHTLVPLRQPLLIFLGFVEPIMAFGRVGRILGTRWVMRRQRQAEEMAEAQREWDAQHNSPGSFAQPGANLA